MKIVANRDPSGHPAYLHFSEDANDWRLMTVPKGIGKLEGRSYYTSTASSHTPGMGYKKYGEFYQFHGYLEEPFRGMEPGWLIKGDFLYTNLNPVAELKSSRFDVQGFATERTNIKLLNDWLQDYGGNPIRSNGFLEEQYRTAKF
jgi:hypothetical protein